jgi:hypothetical protein
MPAVTIVGMSRCESKIVCLCAGAIESNKELITYRDAGEFRNSHLALFSFVVDLIFPIRTCKRQQVTSLLC